jgi:hypothetical protein
VEIPLTPLPATSPLDQALGGVDLAAGVGLDPFEAAGGPTTMQPIVPTKPRTTMPRWDTMLMYGGGLALALLILFGAVLYVSLTKRPAIEMFEAAMADYRSESYSQATAKFENFLKQYPKDENASEARVRIVLARLRLAAGAPEKGLEAARELIPTIAEEEKFPLARNCWPWRAKG